MENKLDNSSHEVVVMAKDTPGGVVWTDNQGLTVSDSMLKSIPQHLRRAARLSGCSLIRTQGKWSRVPNTKKAAIATPKRDKEIPEGMFCDPLIWKYLCHTIAMGRNATLIGPAGAGKTKLVRAAAQACKKTLHYENLGSTQDPRAALIGTLQYSKDVGTVFHPSAFVKAIQTPGTVVLLDELSRAHPEAWNILLPVLEEGTRSLRLSEAPDSPIITVAKGVCFIATANVGRKYTATRLIDHSVLDRCPPIYIEYLKFEDELSLIKSTYPFLSKELAISLAQIADITRRESASEGGKLTTCISTRVNLQAAESLVHGFSLEEVAELLFYPIFSEEGGLSSERTFVKQVIQGALS